MRPLPRDNEFDRVTYSSHFPADMTPTHHRDRRACGEVLRSLERRVEGLDMKVDHLIWSLPDPYDLRPGELPPYLYGRPRVENYLNDDD